MNDIEFNFENKNVLVIGGSKGIGKQICIEFIKSSANVICVSRTDPNIENLNHIACNLERPEELENVFKKINDLDFLINVAGTNLCEEIDKIDYLEWDRLMNINLKSFFVSSKLALKIMKKNNFGRIVNVSSIAGRNKSIVSGVHYTSSKYGIIGLTKQLSNETSKHNILVNCVCPSQTLTQMLKDSMSDEEIIELESKIPIRRIATTKEQALPVLFLCSKAASYITGCCLDINGGQL